MGKERIVIVLDVGHSMNKEDSESGKSILKMALEAIQLLIQTRVIYDNSSNEIGLIIYGADEIEGGAMVLRGMKKADRKFNINNNNNNN